MTAQHSSYEAHAAQRRASAEYREGYAEARRAFLIGQAVRERRLALGDLCGGKPGWWERGASGRDRSR